MSANRGATRRTRGLLGGRSEEVARRILEAALTELAGSGYAGFRMEAVATLAGVNKTSIYRRWPSRALLVTAVVDRMRNPLRDRPLPDTGQLERDLVEAFRLRAAFRSRVEGRAWARLLSERNNNEVESIIREPVEERRGEWSLMVARGILRREIPPEADPTLLLHVVRAIVDVDPHNASWREMAVQTVLAGARAGTLQTGRCAPSLRE